jgi:hypothetical protein
MSRTRSRTTGFGSHSSCAYLSIVFMLSFVSRSFTTVWPYVRWVLLLVRGVQKSYGWSPWVKLNCSSNKMKNTAYVSLGLSYWHSTAKPLYCIDVWLKKDVHLRITDICHTYAVERQHSWTILLSCDTLCNESFVSSLLGWTLPRAVISDSVNDAICSWALVLWIFTLYSLTLCSPFPLHTTHSLNSSVACII